MTLALRQPLCALVCLLPFVAHAGDARPRAFDGYAGVGVMNFPVYSGSAARQTWVVPLLSFDYKDTAYIYIQRAGVRLLSNADQSMAVGVAAEPRFGYHAGDGPRVVGMATRRDRIEGGPTFEWQGQSLSLSLAYFTDWSNVGGGQSVRLSIFDQLIDTTRWDVGTFVAWDYATHQTAQYYYGVRPQEATSTRPVFDPADALESSLGLSGAYKFTRRYAVMFEASVTVLGGPAANSPIVERKSALVGYLGFASIL